MTSSTNLNVKALIGLARLSLFQVKKFLKHRDYDLKGSEIMILNNDLEYPFYNILMGHDVRLIGVNEDDELLISIDGREQETFDIDKFIIVFFNKKDGKARHVVFND